MEVIRIFIYKERVCVEIASTKVMKLGRDYAAVNSDIGVCSVVILKYAVIVPEDV